MLCADSFGAPKPFHLWFSGLRNKDRKGVKKGGKAAKGKLKAKIRSKVAEGGKGRDNKTTASTKPLKASTEEQDWRGAGSNCGSIDLQFSVSLGRRWKIS